MKKSRMGEIKRTQIFGKHKKKKLPVSVDKEGRLLTRPKINRIRVEGGFSFQQKVWTVETRDLFIPLPLVDISHAYRYVFAVKNAGYADAEVQVQIGPTSNSLMDDEIPFRIAAQKTFIVTPLRFSRLIRLSYRSVIPGQGTRLIITFQAQVFKS